MDVVTLSRLQFAAAIMFHYLFVPLTLGLSILVAMMESRYAKTGDETWLRMTRFWGKLFLINFALGVVTGITLEFQFGTNFSRYSEFVGDVFGSLLAIEATAAFFLESTLLGVWIFGWKKLSAKAHARVMWLVAFGSSLSAVWILIANSWMQHPVGYEIRNGRAEMADFAAVVFQPWAWLTIAHTLLAAYILAAFFVLGISAWHLLRGTHLEVFRRSFRMAAVAALVCSLAIALEGHMHANEVAADQPAKMAAMVSHWETSEAVPYVLFALPDEEAGRNKVEIGHIPYLLSLLAHNDPMAEVKGLSDYPPEDRPPVLITAASFHGMVALGMFFILASGLAVLYRNRIEQKRWLLKILLFAIPLPYIANQLGWIVTEVGRQPWIVYGLMRTSESTSPIATGQVAVSLVGFILVYGLLGAVGLHLIIRAVRKGPQPANES